MRAIEKRFGAVRASRGASLEVAAGEIHALVGENGAGKSTLMHILAGRYAPDAGTVEVAGRDVTGWSTAEAIQAGVGMVHQHFMLVPSLSVAENVVLGREPTRGAAGALWALDMARAVLEVQKLGQQFGLAVDPRRRVQDLSVGEAQRAEILKTLFRGGGTRILILDEPTAVLSPPEVRTLWRALRRLQEDGGTIVLITHKLEEVVEVSDRVTVMRQGETVACMVTRETSAAAIATAIMGCGARDAGREGRDSGFGTGDSAPPPASPESPVPSAAVTHPAPRAPHPALSVRDLVVAGPRHSRAVDGVTFSVTAGEILGLAGVEGNGQTELVEAIAGLRPVVSGTISLAGREITKLGVRERSEAGLAHIPEDRLRRGLVLDYSVADNLILGDQQHFTRGVTLDRDRIASNARVKIDRFDIRPPDPALPARALSGGNQQKVVVAREMGGDLSVLVAAQPTRGVDIGAIELIHTRLRAARAAGKTTLLVSAELNEILALADRVAVMYRGRIVAILPRADASEAVLGALMTGVGDTGASAA